MLDKIIKSACLMAIVVSTATLQAQGEANTGVTGDTQNSVLEQQVVYPPLPPVKVNGIWVSWEEAYGPIVMLPSIQNNSSRRMASSRLRNQPVLETWPYTRSFADPSSRSHLLTGQYPPLQIDFFRLQKLTDQNASQIPPPSTNLTLTLLKSEDSGGVYQTGIEGTITNGIEQNYTVYKLLASNINPLEEIEIFFSEKPNFENPLTTVISRVWSDFQSKTYVVTVEGHHSSGFFAAAFVSDSDKDGLSDGVEKFIFKSCPTNYNSSFLVDLNGDGSPDYPNKEINSLCDGDEDLDQDGWSNEEEISMGTNPFEKQNNNLVKNVFSQYELPHWVKHSLFLYKGAVNAGINTDSDNDGVCNYTELLLRTNPAMFDSIFNSANYVGVADSQRAFHFPSITIGRGNLPVSDTFCEIFGTKGNYFHFEQHANKTEQGTNLVFSSGADTILMNGAYLDPVNPDHNGIQMLTRNGEIDSEMQNCCTSTKELLGNEIQILNSVWCQSSISSSLNVTNLTSIESEIIAQRCKDRILVLMKKIQLLVAPTDSFSQMPLVMQKRIHKFTGDIYMETQLLRKACQQYFYIYDYSSPVNAYCFQFNPGICMIANVANARTNTLDGLSDNYIEDVKNRNNSTNDMRLSSGIKDLILDMTHKTSIEEESLQNVFYEVLSDYNKN